MLHEHQGRKKSALTRGQVNQKKTNTNNLKADVSTQYRVCSSLAVLTFKDINSNANYLMLHVLKFTNGKPYSPTLCFSLLTWYIFEDIHTLTWRV